MAQYVIVRTLAQYPAVADTWSVIVAGADEAISHHESESDARDARTRYQAADRRRARARPRDQAEQPAKRRERK